MTKIFKHMNHINLVKYKINSKIHRKELLTLKKIKQKYNIQNNNIKMNLRKIILKINKP